MNEKENLLDLIEDAKAVSSKSFSELAFNEVDALTFAQLSYFKFDILGLNSPDDRLSFKKIAQTDFECPSSAKARTKCHYELLKTMSESERYGDFFVTDYFTISSETEEKLEYICNLKHIPCYKMVQSHTTSKFDLEPMPYSEYKRYVQQNQQ